MDEVLEWLGLNAESATPVVDLIDLLIVFGVATVVYFVVRMALVRGLRHLVTSSQTHWDDELVRAGVFGRISHIAPAFVVYAGMNFFPELPEILTDGIRRVAVSVMLLVGALAISSVLTATEAIWNSHPEYRKRPIKGYLQVVSILVYLLAGLLILATLMNRSPWIFVSGIGAMTAVLLLVFRDTILSLVASIQIASNDMVRVGDWIEMPELGADGDVIDIALHTVKVQNWDKTITDDPDASADHRLLQELARHVALGWTPHQAIRVARPAERSLPDGRGDRGVRALGAASRLRREQARRTRRSECRSGVRTGPPGRPSPAHEPRHLPCMDPGVGPRASEDPPVGSYPADPPARPRAAGRADRDLLLLERHGLDRLREHPIGPLRSHPGDGSGVRAARLPGAGGQRSRALRRRPSGLVSGEDLAGRVAFVSGASRGIGAGLAEVFAARGLRLVLCSRGAPALEESDDVLARRLDVRDEAGLDALVADAEARFGSIDLWVNNAGVLEPIAPVRDVELDAFRDHIDTNLTGVFLGSRCYVRHLRRRGRGGVLVNVSSGAAWKPYQGWGAYCAGKAGVERLTEVIAAEEAEIGLRAYSVAPGVVDTAMQTTIRATAEGAFPDRPRFVRRKQEGDFNSAHYVANELLAIAFDPAREETEVALRLADEPR